MGIFSLYHLPFYLPIIIFGVSNFFELKSSNLRTYYHKNILAFGDLLHRLHPLAGQGFNMTIRDIRDLSKLIELKFNNGLELDNTKHTATDPIADITYLNAYFYTTNLDNSANAGTQIDLYKFDDELNTVDRFELNMNGQGYLAAANDGMNLYFNPGLQIIF